MPAHPAGRPADEPGAGLDIRDLGHRYRLGFELNDVSLTVPPGAVHGLLGPSGSGKSTVLRLVAGLETAERGTIGLDGRLISAPGRHVPPEDRRIGLMFQDVALFPHLTVQNNVGFGLRLKDRDARRRRISELMDMVGVARHAAKYPHELSGGEQQRVALARTLAADPRAVLLDEAFSALDPSLRGEVRTSVLTILRDAGVPVVMVTHDPDEAIAEADLIHVIEAGRISQAGTVGQLYRAPASRFIAGFFGPVIRFDGKARQGELDTPIGRLPVPDRRDGEPVEVIVRSRDLAAVPAGASPWRATVLACRDMGDCCRVELAAGGRRLGDLHLPNGSIHAAGGEIGLTVDPSLLFAFPAHHLS